MRDLLRFWGIYLLFVVTLFTVGVVFEYGYLDEWLLNPSPVRTVLATESETKSDAVEAAPARPFNARSHDEWRALLKKGGLTLIFRHGSRPEGENDAAFDRLAALAPTGLSAEYATGICLNERGHEEARLLNHVFKTLKLPVGDAWHSPVCRCRETAEGMMQDIAPIIPEPALMCGSMLTADELSTQLDAMKTRLLAPPAPGRHRIVVAHSCSDAITQLGVNLQGTSSMVILEHDAEGGVTQTYVSLYDFLTLLPVQGLSAKGRQD